MKTLYHRTERERWGHHQRLTAPSFWTGTYLLLIALVALVALTVPTLLWAVRPLLNEVGAVGAGATDTSMVALTRAINKVGESFDAYKKTNDERLEALKNGDESRVNELNAKLDKIEKDVVQFAALKKSIETEQQLHRERIEELEARNSTPGLTAVEKRASEYKDAWTAWVRNRGNSPNDEQKMQTLYKEMVIRGDVTIGTGAAGGFAVPEEIAREIERQERKFSPVRNLVKVVQTGTSDYKELVNIRGATSGWIGETGTRAATLTPSLREITPTNGELYAYPQVSEWSLDDMFFNVDAWLTEEVALDFAEEEGVAVISGNGTSKPTGMLNTVPTSVDDFGSPLRAAAVYQFVASAASPDAILPDSLIDLVYKLNSAYRARATFVFNSPTAAAIRKLKDTTNQYLWAPGLASGEPDRLLGYPTAIWEDMQSVGANQHPVAFGDFRRGYVLAQRVGLRITRDNVTNVGFVRFYVRRREGGIVLNNDAIKFLKTT